MIAKLNKIKLGSRIINPLSKPYIIAEIGVNHEGSLDLAKKLIDQAKAGGADAAKFQSYKADTLASKNSPAYWDTQKEPTKSQHALFQKYDKFDANNYIELASHCKITGIDFLSTPFDDEAVDFLAPLVPFYKIASADITNIPFLRKIAEKGKPVVLSTGASNLDEIDLAVKTLHQSGCNDLALLHCVLNYPTSYQNAHLRMIEGLITNYPNYIIGYSDHTLPDASMTSLVAAFMLGAVIIEKHLTHDKSLPGNDHYHAMDQEDLIRFVNIVERIHLSLGKDFAKKPLDTEELSRLNARRSMVLKRNVNKGQKLTNENLTYKRPGTGISPKYWDKVIGKTTLSSLPADHILNWSDIEND